MNDLCNLILLQIVANTIIRPGFKALTSWYASQFISLILCYDISVSMFTLSETYLKYQANRQFEIAQHVSQSIQSHEL